MDWKRDASDGDACLFSLTESMLEVVGRGGEGVDVPKAYAFTERGDMRASRRDLRTTAAAPASRMISSHF
ncbi:hypothetical protein VM1G_11551 [Cytospora mali]|uniref:Uncharacterized protein n=1 Tax=Cytospora mali TaxID=578113 RepID=A0A194VXB3_CYTMA|nr:hypothetical protein VM1G_11551 [Valsa mali]